MGEWSAPISQLMSVAWCCSHRMMRAIGSRSGPFMRSITCFVRRESSSTPFIRMTRTRVKLSSSSLLMGFWTMSFQVNFWRSSGAPRSLSRLRAMSFLSDDFGFRVFDDEACQPLLDDEQVLLLLRQRVKKL